MQPARDSILTIIRNQGDASIRTLAAELGLAIPTVRHHLMVLERDGMLESTPVRDGVGRPSLRYRLTQGGHESFPKKYAWLSKALLSTIRTDLGKERLDRLIRTISRDTIAKYTAELTGKDLEDKQAVLTKLLKKEGYVTRWENDGDILEITLLSCPFRAISAEHLEICQLDQEIIEGVLEIPVRQTACIVQGDSSCKFRLQIDDQG
jgi:predicted ArsR family transcriptional regulator